MCEFGEQMEWCKNLIPQIVIARRNKKRWIPAAKQSHEMSTNTPHR